LVLLCDKIRQKRKEAGKKVSEMAEATGFSSSYISQIERGLTNPSVVALQKIAQALDLPTAYFFEAEQTDKLKNGSNVGIVRKNERKGLLYPSSNIQYQLLSPDLQGAIEFLLIKAPPGTITGEEPFVHHGQEYGIILQGRMEIWVGSNKYVLEEGDSIVFNSSEPHRWGNCGDTELVAVWAVNPPSF
jgi:transcriptional regulator with XRE-family HTH domain